MTYKSIDTIQKLLSDEVFHYTKDRKKAAGRALGTFVEIITYYLLKHWQLDKYIAIERPLPEYGNSEITHNVEFTLHKTILKGKCDLRSLPRLTANSIISHFKQTDVKAKSGNLIDSHNILKNAFTFATKEKSFFNAYLHDNNIEIYELNTQPRAMVECKRVGVEEGMSKGPQTIEKAKQGSYVARTVSSLQRYRDSEGRIMGILPSQNSKAPTVNEYYKILDSILKGEIPIPQNFILTIGVVSNHGNWFTATNMNKEMRVLANSFDWLLFLTDQGLASFVEDLLLYPKEKYKIVRENFIKTYSQGVKTKAFTKSKMPVEVDAQIQHYFKDNINRIEKEWLEVISPRKSTISDLKKGLADLLER